MKKVLYILSNEPTGGVGALVKSYTSCFSDALTVDFLIYTDARDTEFQKAIRRNHNTIHYLPNLSLHYFELKRKTEAFFAEHGSEYFAVHLHFTGIGPLCLPAARKCGIKHIMVHSHNTRLSDSRIKNVRNKLLSDLSKPYANHFFACSKSAAEYLYGKAFCEKHGVYYLNNAIDTAQFRFDPVKREEIRTKMGLEQKTVLLFAGRLEMQKNPFYLMQIMEAYLKLDPEAVLLMAGIGPLEEELRKACASFADHVQFLGFVNNVPELMQASDIFMMPSLYEGLGISAIEAQTAGLPCMLSDQFPEEVDQTDLTCHLSLNAAPEIWAEEIFARKNNKRQDYAQQIKKAGYDIYTEAEKLEEYYLALGDSR